jgi:parvulin-like peptidyl-prolyl isomerase
LKRYLPICALLVFAAGATAQTDPKLDPNRTILIVNGEEVKAAEYYRRMEFLPGVGKRSGNSFAEFPPGFLTIERLITEKLVYELARNKGVYPSDLEVQNEIKSRLQEQPKLLETWKASGRSDAELNEQVRYELAQFKLQTFGITITDQEVQKHYADNPEMFTIPPQVTLRLIAVDSEVTRRSVDAELTAKKPFADVARVHSIDVSKATGGEYGTVPVTLLGPEVRAAVDKVKPGQATEWLEIRRDDGYVMYLKFLVEQLHPQRKQDLTPQLRQGIRRQLMLDRGRVRNNLENELAALRVKAKVDIRQPEFAEAYRQYLDEYLRMRGQGR